MSADEQAIASIFATAAQRAKDKSAPMAGLLTPREAWTLLEAGAIDLVDTRTHAERELIGYVPDSKPIEWYDYPAKARNASFLDELREAVREDRPVAFLCRSGVRSHYAADLAARAGFEGAYNILEGFEGENGAGMNGWRATGLPWKQGKD
jgi:rhodanese-related sulfurtransferase